MSAGAIHVLPVPTPFVVGRVNCYLVDDDPLTLVDAGPNSATSLTVLEAALADAQLKPWRQVLPNVVIMREGWTPWVPVRVPDGSEVLARLHLEDGGLRDLAQVEHWIEPRKVDGVLIGPGSTPDIRLRNRSR